MDLTHTDTENSPLHGPQRVASPDGALYPPHRKGIPDLDNGYCFQ